MRLTRTLSALVTLGTVLAATGLGGVESAVAAPNDKGRSPSLRSQAKALFRKPLAHRPVRHELTGWAALDHSERYPGPKTGQFIASGPYEDQPIPGWSGLLSNGDGTFIALPDNGYGSKANSADYVLGFYVVTPQLKRRGDGTTTPGPVTNNSFTPFNDKLGLLSNGFGVDMLITADFESYRSGAGYGQNTGVAVDPSIRQGRLLTGYDFDVESIARAEDGSYWVGEEFGPFILHFDGDGTLIDEPVPHPVLVSPQHPAALAFPGSNTLGQSRGFESLSFDHEGQFLYAVPEAAPVVDALRPVPGDERVLELHQFDPRTSQYTGVTYKYRKDGAATANGVVIGDMTNVGPNKYVLIERDDFGLDAVIKRLYIIDLGVTDSEGILKKELLVDLLDIDDPRDIGGPLAGLAGDKFNLPFVSVECVVSLDANTLGVAIDTNFPASGRDPGVPASTELITLKFSRPVASLAPRR